MQMININNYIQIQVLMYGSAMQYTCNADLWSVQFYRYLVCIFLETNYLAQCIYCKAWSILPICRAIKHKAIMASFRNVQGKAKLPFLCTPRITRVLRNETEPTVVCAFFKANVIQMLCSIIAFCKQCIVFILKLKNIWMEIGTPRVIRCSWFCLRNRTSY